MQNTIQRIYQYAILWQPTEKQFEDGLRTKFIKELTTILAVNEGAATKVAFMEIPDDYKDQLDQIDVVVRNF